MGQTLHPGPKSTAHDPDRTSDNRPRSPTRCQGCGSENAAPTPTASNLGGSPRGKGTTLSNTAALCYAIMLPGGNSGFWAGFRPDFNRENFKDGPPAVLRPAGGPILRLSRLRLRPGSPISRSEALLRKIGEVVVCDNVATAEGTLVTTTNRVRNSPLHWHLRFGSGGLRLGT